MLIETANRNRTLQVGLSLASVQRDHAMRPNGASGGQNSGETGKTPGHFKGVVANGRIILIWVAVVGRLPSQLLSALCCLFWVVWSAARGARSMRYPKGMAVRWSLWKPRCRVLRCVCPGNWHPTAVGLRGETRTGTHRGPKSGNMQLHTIAGVCGNCVHFFLHSVPLQEVFYMMRVCVFQRPRCLPFAFVFLPACAVADHFHATKRIKKEGHLWSMHPRLQCSSADADLSCRGICARFSLQCLFFFTQESTGGHS
ncbi:syntaxin binding protein [Trypanosoma cruzi]|nr:syntaxin binding protein [Trypanosoma cruzi]